MLDDVTSGSWALETESGEFSRLFGDENTEADCATELRGNLSINAGSRTIIITGL